MSLKKNNKIFIFMFLFFLSVKCTSEKKEEALIDEAKWMYYESNFMKNGIACNNNIQSITDSTTNICFIEGLKIKEINYGDTIEFVINTIIDSNFFCRCIEGMTLNIFGFFPMSDTVSYRSSESLKYKKEIEKNNELTNYEWMGLYSLQSQKIKFKEFIIDNYGKLNNFLKQQAKDRHYL